MVKQWDDNATMQRCIDINTGETFSFQSQLPLIDPFKGQSKYLFSQDEGKIGRRGVADHQSSAAEHEC